jgi:hypothetical protein
MPSVKPRDVVRIVNVINAKETENLFAHVLTVGPGEPPVISVAFMDPRFPNPSAAGSAAWYQTFTRHTGVLHASHPEVADGQHSIYWIDALPTDWPDLADHPTLTPANESAVYSREHADAFFDRKSRTTVPKKVEPVIEGVTVDHTQAAEEGVSKEAAPVLLQEDPAEDPAS